MQVKRLLEEFNGKVESLRRQRVFNKKRRSQWMEGLLAAEEMHKQGWDLGDLRLHYWQELDEDAYAEGFMDYVELTAAGRGRV